MARTIENNDGQIFHVPTQTPRNIFQVFFNRSIDIDHSARRRTDNDLVHVNVRCVEQAATLSGRQDSDRIIRT